METIKTVAIALVVGLVVGGVVVMMTPEAISPREVVRENLGAITGPDMPYNYIGIGGVRLYTAKTSPIQSTTTVICSLQSPPATSTLVVGNVDLTTATSGNTSVSVSKATVPYTVDTAQIIATTSVATGALVNLQMASTTYNSEALSDRVFPPSTYIVVAQQGGGILNQSGVCQALWQINN